MAFQPRWLLILFALILGGGPVFAATKEQSAYNAAVNAFKSEMWSRAETNFIQFIQKYPKSTNAPEAVLLQAQAEFKQGKLADAIALLAETSHLAKAGGLADQYIYWIGEAQLMNGELTNAAGTFVSLARNYPQSPWRLRAVVSAAAAWARVPDWRRHDALLEETNGVFQQAAKLDPGNELVVEGELSLENSKYQQNDFPGVAAVYEQLTNQWQTLNQVQQCQGIYLFYRAKMGLGDFAAALVAATNLVRIAGSQTNQGWLAAGWASQGEALERLDRLPDAIQAWGNNLTNAPVAQEREAILKTAELQIVRGQLTDAGEKLTNFLARFPEAVSADIARLTAGELHLKDYAAQQSATNELSAARECFDQFLRAFTNSALAGKAHLDLGWCEWLAGDVTNSLADFSTAATSQLAAEDLAVARFKMGDAQFALKDFAGARTNYQAVLDDFTHFPAVARTLGDRALYQILRANLQMTNYDGASNAMARIVKDYPASALAPDSALLYGEGLAAATNEPAARAVFQQFLAQFPDSPLRAEVAFAIARTCELEQNWPAAIAGYQGWLNDFPTNGLRPRVFYALALANAQAGNETNAFGLFTNFVAQFQTHDLAPQAQMWVADSLYRAGDFVDAEKNYKFIFQNLPPNGLGDLAQMMAGRAAVARSDYNGARDYFSKLEADTNGSVELRVQAAFADGEALMRMDSTDTNNLLANFQRAINVYSQIRLMDPTNEAAGLLAACAIGDCDLQLNNFDAATNAYAQVFTSTSAAAGVALRSRAQIGFGLALEKKALFDQALDNYLDVFNTLNLRDGETKDDFLQKKAGLLAAPLVGRLNDVKAEKLFYGTLKEALPQLSDLIDKKIAALPPETN